MFTSATEPHARQAGKTALAYLLIAILVALAGAIYEQFSHGVYAYFMIYAFAFPLVAGALPFQILHLFPVKRYPLHDCRQLYHCGIASFTVGSIVQGVLDIYGTTNAWVFCYWWSGIVLIILSVLRYLFDQALPR